MTPFEIVALYVALNLALLCVLTVRVFLPRIKNQVSLGDGGDPALLARIRAHANFVETAPFGLIGLFALAGLGAAPLVLHVFGITLTAGRALHAVGMAGQNALGQGRPVGMVLTMLVLIGEAAYLLGLLVGGAL